MSLLRLHGVTVRFDDRQVLREVFFKLAKGERVGLIGQNGTGKTTLIRLFLNELAPTEGRVEQEAGLKVGYFSQFSQLDSTLSVEEVLGDVLAEPRAIEAELEAIGTQFADEGVDLEVLLERQAELLGRMEVLDGWNWQVAVETVLGKLGFNAEHRTRPISQLSGGWRNRAALAKILLEAPEVLLLDEPTNYLDVEGVAWLEEWLRGFPGAVLLVSHDRQFLDRVVTRIVELENYRLSEYAGGYSDYIREKPFRLKTSERQFLHEEELLLLEAEALKEHKERRERKVADLKKRVTPRPAQILITEIYEGLHVRDNLMRAEDICKAYGEQTLFTNLTLELHGGERLAIVGRNGSGKSTLLRVLTGEEAPDSGMVRWEGGVKAVHFNQLLENLDPKDTLSHAINTFGLAFHAPRKHVHKFLEMLRFSEMDRMQRLGTLSGGQKSRVALAQCLLSGSPVIILDEPTNHLDMPSIQVMEQALVHFPGAVIVVSHDRFFLDKVATRKLIFVGDGKIREESA
ncbi:ABC-F family ATP-binding cassette domain-containing protein [Armatimonas sp.]|uniref:ABC-F family ATP-binding cassette domain-containing protein n=1 Tax=Armatimonas sp. TaxID=1872638 RepID=UPI003752880F